MTLCLTENMKIGDYDGTELPCLICLSDVQREKEVSSLPAGINEQFNRTRRPPHYKLRVWQRLIPNHFRTERILLVQYLTVFCAWRENEDEANAHLDTRQWKSWRQPTRAIQATIYTTLQLQPITSVDHYVRHPLCNYYIIDNPVSSCVRKGDTLW